MAQPVASLGLLRPAACIRSYTSSALTVVPFINGARRRLAFRSRAWRARLVGCRAAGHAADIVEYVEGHVQSVDASTLSSSHWAEHDKASQTVHMLQDLVAQMKEIGAQADELNAMSEFQPTADGCYVLGVRGGGQQTMLRCSWMVWQLLSSCMAWCASCSLGVRGCILRDHSRTQQNQHSHGEWGAWSHAP
jgi:hypothetical protein